MSAGAIAAAFSPRSNRLNWLLLAIPFTLYAQFVANNPQMAFIFSINIQIKYVMQDNKKEYKRAKFADAVDQINNKLGKSIIIYGAQGIQKEPVRFNTAGSNWQMKSYYRSPAYTTRWDELLKVF